MPDPFFSLPGQPTDIDDDEQFLALTGGRFKTIRSRIYRPPSLRSPEAPLHWRIRNCSFVEVSFSKTVIEDFEFSDCDFVDCRFIGTIFMRCRFINCTFTRCNMYRCEFSEVFVNPRSFENCTPAKYQNIGAYLYHELLNNSRRQSQPDFAQEALYQFRRWQRSEDIYTLSMPGLPLRRRAGLVLSVISSWAMQAFLGHGVRVKNYICTAVIVALAMSVINYKFASSFGLKLSSFVDALYFTVITLTTVGYGDITATETAGRLVMTIEAISGFVLFAILASMIYRKIQP